MEEKKLGAAIRQAREEKGLSQEKLAEYVEVSRQAVSKWETGLAVPTEENLKRLEQALDLPDGELTKLSLPTEEVSQMVKKSSFLGWAAAMTALSLALGVGGFFLGRATVPSPAVDDPETKTIWRLTANHIEPPRLHDEEVRNTYDEMGRLMSRELLGSQADPTVTLREFTYDEAGNRIRTIAYDDGELAWSEEYEFDDMGNQTLFRSLNADGSPKYWHEATYDDHGHQTTFQQFDADGKLTTSWRYNYTYYEDGSYEQDYFTPANEYGDSTHIVQLYDPHGNMIKQTVYDLNGNVTRTETMEYQSFEVPVGFDPDI